MDIKQATAKLNSVSNSTATKHNKLLISDLCAVVKFLLDEIDRIKTPTVYILPKRLPEDVSLKPRVIPIIKPQFPPPGPPYPKVEGPQKFRSGNAGDAE